MLTTGAVIMLHGETGEELAHKASVPFAGEAIEYPALGGALRLNVTAIDLAIGDTTVLAEGLSPAFTLNSFLPIFMLNSVAVAPSGNIYVTSPGGGNVWRILAD